MREADNGCFADGSVFINGAFNFRCAQVVAGDDDDVINTAGNPVVPFFIPLASIARKIFSGKVEKYVSLKRW